MTMINSFSDKEVTINQQQTNLEIKLEKYFFEHNSVIGAKPLSFYDLPHWINMIRTTYKYSFFRL